MGNLVDQIKLESKGNIPQYYKDNTVMLYNKYKSPDELVKPIPVKKMSEGLFYFLMYQDESNWMQYSPIFFVDWKEFGDMIIGYGVNMNFIPLEHRAALFDNIIRDLDNEDQVRGMSFEGMYKQLLRMGYEYALVEYDMRRIVQCYHISVKILPKFLYSSYPKNKYDPKKLYDIWAKKLAGREQRHQEIIKQLATDFYKTTEEIEMKYDELSDHMKRVQRNHKKFGGG